MRAELCWLTVAVFVVACAGSSCGQDGPNEKELLPFPKSDAEVFWEVRQRGAAAAAAQLVVEPNPLIKAFLRLAYEREQVWPEQGFVGDEAPPLDAEALGFVRDGTPMPKVAGKLDDELRPDQLAIYKLYNQALIQSFHSPLDAFIKSAEHNEGVRFDQLYRDPDFYRGKIIKVEGRLKRLRRQESTERAKLEGVRVVYEGWIFGSTPKSPPFWVLFTVLPDKMQPAEDMDRQVTFYGYFLKKMKYQSSDKKGTLETPFLIGPTVILTNPPAVPATGRSVPVVLFFIAVGIVAAVTVALIALNVWFRRGDRAMQNRLLEMRMEQAKLMVEDAGDREAPPPQPEILDKEGGAT